MLKIVPLKQLVLISGLLLFAGCNSNKINKVGYQITVQPIVVRGDDGKNPAAMRIHPKLLDRFFSCIECKVKFLPIKYWDNSAARDGKKNLNQLVKQAMQAKLMVGNGDVINMFFINAVDGHQGPLGRALQGGSTTFIAMVGSDSSTVAKDTFVVAHEMSHNLSLNHIVDDPNVPNNISNIMGDGKFEDRIKPENMTQYQIDIMKRSPLVQKL